MDLKERKLKILKTLIEYYIQTGQPVGSRTITEKYGLGLSPATIRNEMAGLEELGFLEQPHISAGRIPSDKAYRYYVDKLMEITPLTPKESDILNALLSGHMDETEGVMKQIVNALSDITNCVAIAMVPKISSMNLKDIKMIKVTDNKALMILVTEKEIIKDTVLRIPDDMDQYELDMLCELLKPRLLGKRLDNLGLLAKECLAGALSNRRDILQQVMEQIRERMFVQKGTQLVLGGTSKLLDYPEYSDVNNLKLIIGMLEEEERLLGLFRGMFQDELKIVIGSENKISSARVSIVASNYDLDEDNYGTLGIIGPVRMDYSKMLAVLDYMSKNIAGMFENFFR